MANADRKWEARIEINCRNGIGETKLSGAFNGAVTHHFVCTNILNDGKYAEWTPCEMKSVRGEDGFFRTVVEVGCTCGN